MKKYHTLLRIILITVLINTFTACGEDGDPGAAGAQGGKGDNGQDGLGFEEGAQYGKINISLAGRRPDSVSFEKDIAFKFTPVGVVGLTSSSTVSASITGDTITFQVRRFYSTVDESLQDNQVTISFSVTADGDKYTFFDVTCYIRTVITTPDFKYFTLEDNYGDYAIEGIKKYTYNPATGKLQLGLDFTVPGDYEFNNTGHDLQVSLDTDVKVFESL